MKKSVMVTVLLFFVIGTCSATDINGSWTGKIDDNNDVTYYFKAVGSILIGYSKGQDGHIDHLSNGVLNNDEVSFTIDMSGEQVKVSGKIKDDVMTIKYTLENKNITVELVKL